MYAHAQSRPNSFYAADDAAVQPDYPSEPPRRLRQSRVQGSPNHYQSPQQPVDPDYDPDDDQPLGLAGQLPDAADEFYGAQQNGSTPFPAQQSHSQSPLSQGPLLDHSHLRPGNQASLLSYERTLELYRANAKKTQDPDIQFEFAVFMIDASKSFPIPAPTPGNVMEIEKAIDKRDNLVHEATGILKRLADRGHPSSQYFLADCYANGLGTYKNKQDFDRAYPLFVLAAKHGHPDAAYRAGTCCENGWGCRRESAKALQFFRKAGAALHPGAMYRLGIADLNGELGLSKRPREGVKWLKRSAEHATAEFPHALHELALLHERGIDNVVFVDVEYTVELLAQAAELGYAPSAYRLGECYEYGKLGCPQDPALSIHYYNIAAQQNHRDACFALTAWYLVGSPGVLPQSDTEAYLWARKAADAGLAKAMYAVGYFLEVGIGTPPDLPEAMNYFKKASELGDKRAQQRLKGPPIGQQGGVMRDGPDAKNAAANKDCVIM
ncbi:HCP-like protein [Suillus clintonianus]|uniref:HCP-like protein n=1 Tax=Suillus clintonianus TaxID=1904413 RepID=UPI001B86F124|nr:HCP-like protein [Suillus clintonianus]KAG2155747.1 HCP-like protein [Suillus clintonianus]